MAIRLNGAYPTRNNSGLAVRSYPTATAPWVRNPSWPACEANAGDNRIVGLYAVYPGDGSGAGGNFFAVTIVGAYTINYGDGTTTNYTTGQTAYYEFNYNDADLAGTDAPVTFTDSTDTVNRTAHGYTNGMTVRFYNIVTTTGLSENTPYYVVNATANTFQVSATVGGSAIALTNDGSATLLPYKIATVTITPQAGQNLTLVNLFVKHNQSGLVNQYATGWLDLAIATPSCTSLTISGSSTTVVRHSLLERVRINELGNVTNFVGLFYGCFNLQSVSITASTSAVNSTNNMFYGCYSLTTAPLFNTAAVTTMTNMFQQCYSLTTVPVLNTALVNNMTSMFSNCTSLKTVPLLNTASVTNMSSMFTNCFALESVPLFNTALVNNMNSMFYACSSLAAVPLLNTASVTNMGNMFYACYSLTSVPLFNTAAATSMANMFQNCYSLTTVPLFNTASVNTMNTMFSNCYALLTVPLFNTSLVTNMASMFSGCYSLVSVPLFNTASVLAMANMFQNCASLTSIPSFNTASCTQIASMFSGCSSLQSVPRLNVSAVPNSTGLSTVFGNCSSLTRILAKDFKYTFSVASCRLSAAALDEIYTNLPTVTGQTITVTGNYGTAADNPAIATAKGWTVTG